MSDPLSLVSVGLEAGVSLLLILAMLRGRPRLFGFALAFLLFLAAMERTPSPSPLPSTLEGMMVMFAAWSALWSAWQLYSHPAEKTA